MALNADQERFAEVLSGQTGLNLQVVRAWVTAEGGNGSQTGHNWLNISQVPPGYKSTGHTNSAGWPTFQNADQAALATAAFINKWQPNIGASVGSSQQNQILAIVNSGWASGHYGATGQNPLGTIGADFASLGTSPGTGGIGSGAAAATAQTSSTQTNTGAKGPLLFSGCHSSSGTIIPNWIPGGHGGVSVPVPDVVCYLVNGMEAVALALGGLLLMAVGGIMVVSGKHPAAALSQVTPNRKAGPTDFQVQQEARRSQQVILNEQHRQNSLGMQGERLEAGREKESGTAQRAASMGPSLNLRRESEATINNANAKLREVQADVLPDTLANAFYIDSEKLDVRRMEVGERTAARKGDQKIKRQRIKQDEPVKRARAKEGEAKAYKTRGEGRILHGEATRQTRVRKNIDKSGPEYRMKEASDLVENANKNLKIKGTDPTRME